MNAERSNPRRSFNNIFKIGVGFAIGLAISRRDSATPFQSPGSIPGVEPNPLKDVPTTLYVDLSGESDRCPTTFCASGFAGPTGCENDGGNGGFICGSDGQWILGQSDIECDCTP